MICVSVGGTIPLTNHGQNVVRLPDVAGDME